LVFFVICETLQLSDHIQEHLCLEIADPLTVYFLADPEAVYYFTYVSLWFHCRKPHLLTFTRTAYVQNEVMQKISSMADPG